MRESKVQALVTFISCSGKVMFLLLFGHGIPLLITAPIDGLRQHGIPNTTTSFRCSPVDRNVKDLASNKCTDIPANNGDENFISSKIVWPNNSISNENLESRKKKERLTCPECDKCSTSRCSMLERTYCTMP